jgi:hypothetical protein
MSSIVRASSKALVFTGVLLAGCAGDGSNNLFTTGALGTPQSTASAPEPKVDPACVSLVSQIETLRKEGVADKIEKAATKKYKLTKGDLTKADQLTKANAEFQLRCSTIMPRPMSAQAPAPTPAPAAKAAPKTAAPKAAAKAAAPKAAASTTPPASSQN